MTLAEATRSLLGLPRWIVEIRQITSDAAGHLREQVKVSMPYVDEQLARTQFATLLHDRRLRFDTGRLRLVLRTADTGRDFLGGAA